MNICRGFTETVGKTPLIRLNKFSDETGCEILGKAEFLNPGGSVKDRAALFMIQDGINRKLIKPGGLIVEGTAGNTGIGLTLCANSLGYRSLIIIPETQSQEKKDMLKLCGAELIENPALPFSDPNNYQHVAKRPMVIWGIHSSTPPRWISGSMWQESKWSSRDWGRLFTNIFAKTFRSSAAWVVDARGCGRDQMRVQGRLSQDGSHPAPHRTATQLTPAPVLIGLPNRMCRPECSRHCR